MSVYIIAIGGTGAKFVEAISHMAAAGLYSQGEQTEKIEILFVDPDKGNGSLKASNSSVRLYQNCAKTIDCGVKENPNWMQAEVSLFQEGLWSPFKDQEKFRLRDVFKYDDYDDDDEKENVRHLFDVLYTSEERDLDLKEGFRGRPAIGAGIMAKLAQDEASKDSLGKLITQIADEYSHDPSNPPKVFLCGSIFGGTGASGFPTLGRLIANELESRGDLLSKIKLGGLLILPYFRFSSPGQTDKEKIYAKSEEFILKTEAALRYYGSQDLKFDSVYLLGMPTMTNVEHFSIGGASQRNQPHVLELYASLALKDFMFTAKPPNKQVILLSRAKPNLITWEDIPEKEEVRKKITDSVRFAYIWLSVIVPDLEYAKIDKTKMRDVHFAGKFYDSSTIKDSSEWDKISAIKNWSETYLKWLGIIHENGNSLNFLNSNIFYDKDRGELKLDRDKFPDVIQRAGDVVVNRYLHALNNRDIEGVDKGTTGLAKALYLNLSKKIV